MAEVRVERVGDGFVATNDRGARVGMGSSTDQGVFTPVELLLAALAGCTAIDVDLITGKRATPDSFGIHVEGDKVRDDGGSHLVDLSVTVSIRFPEGEAGDRAREVLPRAVQQTGDRLCTVGRTLQLGTAIAYAVD
jgi:uncharacterized OsmC-like protein